jgi:hypothetical protein
MNGNGHQPDHDFDAPQREAAFFFGLFLRGHDADRLRRDIDFPQEMLVRLHRQPDTAAGRTREEIQQIFEYRKRVLAIFNFLVNSETGTTQ